MGQKTKDPSKRKICQFCVASPRQYSCSHIDCYMTLDQFHKFPNRMKELAEKQVCSDYDVNLDEEELTSNRDLCMYLGSTCCKYWVRSIWNNLIFRLISCYSVRIGSMMPFLLAFSNGTTWQERNLYHFWNKQVAGARSGLYREWNNSCHLKELLSSHVDEGSWRGKGGIVVQRKDVL